MTSFTCRILAPLALIAMSTGAQAASIFNGGTIFLSSTILTGAAASTFGSITSLGVGERETFDRRSNNWVTQDMYLFKTDFLDGLSSEVRVNMEFDAAAALQQAIFYSGIIGKLPTVLRGDVQSVWIHDGVEGFGGGNDSLLIHTGQGESYDRSGILEETFVHEATHTSLDPSLANSAGWLAAQQADNMFISPYAEQYSDREDLAETFLMWLALQYNPTALRPDQVGAIQQGIPNRIKFLNEQNFNLYPFGTAGVVPEPAAWMTMLTGFGLVGATLRRRRRVRVTFA